MTKTLRNFQTLILLSVAMPLTAFAASQTITFDAIPNQIFGVSPFPIMAQASSGLPVTFTSTTPGVCKNAGSLVMLLSAGPCFITASQAGNGTYTATSLTRSFIVSLAKPSGTLTANSGSPFAVGASPESVVVGDFNGDGIQDLATANSGDNTITVLLGNGFGGFNMAAGSPLAGGTSPGSLVTGDFNGDGIQDLATAGASGVSVLLADGFGEFVVAAGSPFAVGTESLATGDFNGDGIEDLAVAGTNGVSVLLGNGFGGFTAAAGSPVLTGAVRCIVVADFNGDGIQDLAVAGTGGISVLSGNGAGGFTGVVSSAPGSSGSNIAAMVVGDFNSDGIPDLAVAGGYTVSGECFNFKAECFFAYSDVTVLLGNGAGGFTAGGSFTVGGAESSFSITQSLFTSLVVGDFNGDGVPDLVADATVLLGDGLGGLTPTGTYTGSGGAFAVGDFNGDGLLDLAVANAGANSVSVLMGGIDSTTSLLGTTSPLAITVGQPVSLTVTVSDTTTAFDTPTGTTTLFDGATVLGSASQSVSSYTFTVPSLALGLHTLTAVYSGDLRNSGSSSNTIAIQVDQTQTITFATLNNVGYGVPPFTIGATSSSGLTVSLASTTPSVCTVFGTTVTIVAVGTCSITASQPGNATYSAAVAVTQSFIASNDQLATSVFPSGAGSITISPQSSGNYYSYGSIVCVTAIPTAGYIFTGWTGTALNVAHCLAMDANAPVTANFTSAAPIPSVASVAPNTVPAYSPATAVTIAGSNFVSGATVSFTPPGGVAQTIAPSLIQAAQLMATIPASFLTTAGTAQIAVNNGFGAFSSAVAFTITAATQTIAFDAIPNPILGVSPFVIAAQASSLLPVSFASTTPAVCKAAANLVTLLSAGTCSITASQGGSANYGAATAVTRSFTVSQAKVSGSFMEAAGSPFDAGIGIATFVATGDFNGDGIPDLATIDNTLQDGIFFESAAISVFLGNGTGGFTQAPGSPFAVAGAAVSLATGDFNGDGITDLATAASSAGEVIVLLGNGTGGFTPAPGSPFTAGTIPEQVVVGDFNGDGIQDLATANYDSGNVTVLLGNGAGGFTAAAGSPFGAGSGATRIAVGDFNGDGIQDLAVTNQNDNDVTVLLGNGAGGFIGAAGSPIAVGSFPGSLVVGDFNRDGIQDLAVANENDNNITVLLGNGVGGFTPATGSPFAAGTLPQSVRVGDFNGDGIQDLAATNAFSNNITILQGNGSGGFTPMANSPLAAGTYSADLALGDFNGDGILDIAATNTGGAGSVTVFLGTVVGTTPQTITFGAPSEVNYGVAPFAIGATSTSGLAVSFSSITPFVCTVNGSTVTIVYTGSCTIVASQAGNSAYAAAATVAQSFTISIQTPTVTSVTPNATPANSPATAITIAGTNFGGAATVQFTPPGGTPQTISPSLVQAAQLMATIPAAFLTTAGTAQVAVTNGFTAFSNPVAFTITPAAQTISFDAIPNQVFGEAPFVIAAEASSGLPITFSSATPGNCHTASNLVTIQNTGVCSITASQAGNPGYNAAASATRSFNVRYAKSSGTLQATSLSPINIGAAPLAAALGDFNGDGIQDIATANYSSGNVTVLLGNGSGGFAPSPGSPFAVGSGPAAVAVGDFNADGIEDLAAANYGGLSGPSGNTITVLLGNGAGGFTPTSGSPLTVGNAPFALAIGDFNGDGIQDIATSNEVDSTITVLLGNGAGGFAAAAGSPFATGKYPNSIVVGDFNGDGAQDLAAVNSGDDSVTVLLGNGLGGFTAAAQSPFAVGSEPQYLVTGDFNGDGIQDLATSNFKSNDITVLLGSVTGGFTYGSGGTLPTQTYPSRIAMGDFNGDGIPDLAAVHQSSPDAPGSVEVLLGNGSGGFTAIAGGPYGATYPASLVVGDFNRDGVTDVATINYDGESITVLLGGAATALPTLTTTSALAIPPGQSIPLVLVLSDTTPGFHLPTGIATFFDGTTSLGTASQVTSPYTFTASGLNPGIHLLTAAYSGDIGTAGSTSNAIAIQVGQAQTITFAPLPNVPVGTAPFALSATASSGYAVSFISNTPTVCSVSGGMVTIIAGGGCSITATQAGDSTYAAAQPVTQKFTVPFGDVSTDDIFYAEVNAFAQYGITSGCALNQFCPTANVTRDEMAVFIVRAIYGNDNFTYTTTPYFTDVTPSTFGFQWIQKLKDLGITSGCTATTYCPGEVVTRDQMAIFVIRARLGVGIAGATPTFTYPSTPYFTDATVDNEFAFAWIQRMRLENITSGCTATTYCSSQPVTREEMATFIMRGAFNQFLPAGTPVISQISPAVLAVGGSGTFTVTGVNTNFVQGTTLLSPIPGVTIGSVTVTGPTSLTVQLTAASDAVAQPYSVLAITGSEQDVLPNGLVLQ